MCVCITSLTDGPLCTVASGDVKFARTLDGAQLFSYVRVVALVRTVGPFLSDGHYSRYCIHVRFKHLYMCILYKMCCHCVTPFFCSLTACCAIPGLRLCRQLLEPVVVSTASAMFRALSCESCFNVSYVLYISVSLLYMYIYTYIYVYM